MYPAVTRSDRRGQVSALWNDSCRVAPIPVLLRLLLRFRLAPLFATQVESAITATLSQDAWSVGTAICELVHIDGSVGRLTEQLEEP